MNRVNGWCQLPHGILQFSSRTIFLIAMFLLLYSKVFALSSLSKGTADAESITIQFSLGCAPHSYLSLNVVFSKLFGCCLNLFYCRYYFIISSRMAFCLFEHKSNDLLIARYFFVLTSFVNSRIFPLEHSKHICLDKSHSNAK